MSLFSKWLAAGLISTSLIFSGSFAEAKTKHTKAHKTQVKHKKAGKKHAKKSVKSQKKSEGYAKASGYMKRTPASVTHTKKKKVRKVRRT